MPKKRAEVETKKEPLFSVGKQHPPFHGTDDERMARDPEKTAEILKAIKTFQKIEQDSQGRFKVEINLQSEEPLMILQVADLHTGSLASDHDAIELLKNEILAHPNVAVVLAGDLIEGLKIGYLNTNGARSVMDVHGHMDLVKALFIEPLAKEGRILATTSGYWGHEGWVHDGSTVNPWILLSEEFGIPILTNGGSLELNYPSGKSFTMKIHHNPPSKSKFDPVNGLRDELLSFSVENRPDYAGAGHLHRAGVAKQFMPASLVPMTLVNNGTLKSSSRKIPKDVFGEKLSLGLADGLGQGVVVYPNPNKSSTGTPREKRMVEGHVFSTVSQGLLVAGALDLFDKLESQGMTDEIMQQILEAADDPVITFKERSSRRSGVQYDELPKKGAKKPKRKPRKGRNPNSASYELNGSTETQYDKLVFDIKTQLPISLDFISNVRVGADASGIKPLERYMSERFSDNPFAFMALLRNIIDKSVASNPKRLRVLNDFLELVNRYPEKALFLLHDSNLRAAAWKKHLDGGWANPIPAATHLAQGTGAKLIRHQSGVSMTVGEELGSRGKAKYSGMYLDKLNRHGSQHRPTWGPMRTYQKFAQDKPGMVVGGHMPSSGVASIQDRSNSETEWPVFVGPGWWAQEVNTGGSGNAGPGAVPGQAVIMMPGRKKDRIVIPTASHHETILLHDALILYHGLRILGLSTSDF